MLPSLNKKADDRATGDFLKLDNDVSLSKSGLKVETILFDKSTNQSRSKNIFTLIFGKVMEWRAKNWVKNFVEKNKDYLPGAEKFLKNINFSDGVKRGEVMSLLSAAKITRSPIFLREEGNTNGLKINYLIKDSSESVIDFFVKTINPAPSHDAVKVFLDFIEKGSSAITYGNAGDALNFLDNFREWSEKNSEENLAVMIKGNVNLFRSSLIKKINEFNITGNLLKKNEVIKNRQNAKHEKNIEDAFKAVFDAEKEYKLLSNEILATFGASSISDFMGYVKNGASAINFSNIQKLESWVDGGMQKFIDKLSFDYQYLLPSLQVVVNQLKMDIKEFKGESYKVAVEKPAFLSPKISVGSDDDAQ
jgi:hypothetical protein